MSETIFRMQRALIERTAAQLPAAFCDDRLLFDLIRDFGDEAERIN